MKKKFKIISQSIINSSTHVVEVVEDSQTILGASPSIWLRTTAAGETPGVLNIEQRHDQKHFNVDPINNPITIYATFLK